jgi:hypothetical protein
MLVYGWSIKLLAWVTSQTVMDTMTRLYPVTCAHKVSAWHISGRMMVQEGCPIAWIYIFGTTLGSYPSRAHNYVYEVFVIQCITLILNTITRCLLEIQTLFPLTVLSKSEIYNPRNALAPASIPNKKYNFPYWNCRNTKKEIENESKEIYVHFRRLHS